VPVGVRGGGVSHGGLFERGEMAVSVRVFCGRAVGRIRPSPRRTGREVRFVRVLPIRRTVRCRNSLGNWFWKAPSSGGKEIVTVKGARIPGL
jgi:hypothetical protein